jgi:hypothetical protein
VEVNPGVSASRIRREFTANSVHFTTFSSNTAIASATGTDSKVKNVSGKAADLRIAHRGALSSHDAVSMHQPFAASPLPKMAATARQCWLSNSQEQHDPEQLHRTAKPERGSGLPGKRHIGHGRINVFDC